MKTLKQDKVPTVRWEAETRCMYYHGRCDLKTIIDGQTVRIKGYLSETKDNSRIFRLELIVEGSRTVASTQTLRKELLVPLETEVIVPLRETTEGADVLGISLRPSLRKDEE
jgi:hypothetical protein